MRERQSLCLGLETSLDFVGNRKQTVASVDPFGHKASSSVALKQSLIAPDGQELLKGLDTLWWWFLLLQTLIQTFFTLFLSFFLSSVSSIFFFLSRLFVSSSSARSSSPSLSFLSRLVFSYSFPLPLLYLQSRSSCFLRSPLSLSLCYLFWLWLSSFNWGFHARGERLRHLKPFTPSASPPHPRSSIIPSLVLHFSHVFPAPILILLWFLWPTFLLCFWIHWSVGPTTKIVCLLHCL